MTIHLNPFNRNRNQAANRVNQGQGAEQVDHNGVQGATATAVGQLAGEQGVRGAVPRVDAPNAAQSEKLWTKIQNLFRSPEKAQIKQSLKEWTNTAPREAKQTYKEGSKKIYEVFKKFNTLTLLHLSNNQLTTLPDAFNQLTQLQELSLRNNQLKTLPNSLNQLTQLKWLNLENNQFTHIPRVLLDLPADTEIRLRGNPLSAEEIRLFRAEIQQRRNQGLAVPQFTLPEVPIHQELENWVNTAPHNQLATLPDSLDQLAQQTHIKETRAIFAEVQEKRNQGLSVPKITLPKVSIHQELKEWVNSAPNDNKARYKEASKKILKAFTHPTVFALDFEGKNLTSLPVAMGQLTQLKELWLANNQLATLPDSLSQLTQLKELWLENNQLTTLPESFGQLAQLKTLNLAKNQFTHIPRVLLELPAETEIFLHYNPLPADEVQAFRAEIQHRLNQGLAVPRFKLPEGLKPQEMTNWVNSAPNDQKKTYEEVSNKIFEVIENPTKSTSLLLGGNNLTSIPNSIGLLTQLTGLNLNNNQLTTLPNSIDQLSALESFYLHNNQLNTLPDSFGHLTQLKFLSISNNQLTTLPKSFDQLTKLAQLNLDNNQFTHIPRVLLNLPATTKIFLRNNPLPADEIRAFRTEIQRRRNQGRVVPQFILPELRKAAVRSNNPQNNALRLAVENSLNVDSAALSNAFKAILDHLAAQFPNDFTGSAEQQKAQLQAIETRGLRVFEQFAQNHPDIHTATTIAQTMFQKAYRQQDEYYKDFKYTSGHVLAYVVLAMERQWEQTPQQFLPAAKQNGAELLINFMAAGKDFCDTHHLEEVLQMISLPLSEYAKQHPEIVNQLNPTPISTDELRVMSAYLIQLENKLNQAKLRQTINEFMR